MHRARRAFLGILATFVSPAGFSQQAEKVYRVGMLGLSTSTAEDLRSRLRSLGYVEGKNLVVDARPMDEDSRLAAFAAEIVAKGPDVIVALNSGPTRAVLRATKTIPVVMYYVAD